MNKNKLTRKDLRVLQKNMVYCSGLPSHLTQDDLRSQSYFGQYGKVDKIVMTLYPNRNYCSVYLTFAHEFEAATAILACNEFQINRSTLWCLFGTMKYCKFFLKKIQCKNIPNCPYLHVFDSQNEIQIQSSPSEAYPQHEALAREVMQSYPHKISEIRKKKAKGGQLPEPLLAVECLEIDLEDSSSQCDSQGSEESIEEEIQREGSEGQKCFDSSSTEQQSSKQQVNLDELIKNMLRKKLQKSTASRLVKSITEQEINLRQIILNGLLE